MDDGSRAGGRLPPNVNANRDNEEIGEMTETAGGRSKTVMKVASKKKGR